LKTTALRSIPITILFAGFEGDLDTERKSLLLMGHLNLALCYLKLEEHLESRDQCDKALKLDPSSEKGLFRRLVTAETFVLAMRMTKSYSFGGMYFAFHISVNFSA
jgi:Tfp pilus assembly protein PilF